MIYEHQIPWAKIDYPVNFEFLTCSIQTPFVLNSKVAHFLGLLH